MRATLALCWRNLLRTINPPLHLTPRDKQRMLYLLDKSLRKQIDATYGKVNQKVVEPHVQSLLENPTMSARALQLRLAGAKESIGKTIENPIEYLREAMSRGSATEATVRRCLKAQLAQSLRSPYPATSVHQSGAADVLMQWLWASGRQRNLGFLSDHALTSVMIRILVAGGRRDHVMKWIRLPRKKSDIAETDHTASKAKARLLLETIKAEAMYGSIESALALFLENVKMGFDHNGFQKGKQKVVVGPSAQFLMHRVRDQVQRGTLSVSQYNLLQESLPLWSPAITFESALLSLNHPEHPDADLAFDFIQSLSSIDLARLPAHRRAATADMALRAAEEYMKQRRHRRVALLLTALKTHFADVIGFRDEESPAMHQPATTKENQNVELLNALALG